MAEMRGVGAESWGWDEKLERKIKEW